MFSFQRTWAFQEGKVLQHVHFRCSKAIQVFTFPFGCLKESAILAFELRLNKFWILQKAILKGPAVERKGLRRCSVVAIGHRTVVCNTVLTWILKESNQTTGSDMHFAEWAAALMILYLFIWTIVQPRMIRWASALFIPSIASLHLFSHTHRLLVADLHRCCVLNRISVGRLCACPQSLSASVY